MYNNQLFQLWIEAYLTNGKTIQSNVAEFRTHMSVELIDQVAQPSTAEKQVHSAVYL